MTDSKKLIPVAEAIEAATGIKFHRNTIADWRKARKLKCVQIGKRWYANPSDVIEVNAIDRSVDRSATKCDPSPAN